MCLKIVYINYIIGEILTVGWRFVVVSKCCRQKGKEAKKIQSVGTVDFLRYVPPEREKTSLFEDNFVGCERSEAFFSLAGDMAEKIVSIFTRLN